MPPRTTKFTDELQSALAKDGLPVRQTDRNGDQYWDAPRRDLEIDGLQRERETIHIADDTALRLEAGRLCMMCGVLVGSILFMAIMFAAVFWHDLEITQRLTALLYGEVV